MKRGMLLLTSSLILSTQLYAEHNRIGDQWRASQEYQHYLELEKQGKSKEASKVKEETITALTHEVLKDFISSYLPKFQNRMQQRVLELPIGLQGLLGDIDMQVKEKLNSNHDALNITKINSVMFNFVSSIYYDKGLAKTNVHKLIKLAPELKGTKIAQFLLEIGGNYDKIAEAKEKQAEAKEKAAESRKKAAEERKKAAQWQEIIDMLKKY